MPIPRAGTPHKNTSPSGIGYDEHKLGWLGGVVSQSLLVGHATSVRPDEIRASGGLDPQYSPFDMVEVDSSTNLYEQFVYAFALGSEDPPTLSKAHRMSSWAVVGNYLYVFNAQGRRYMSCRKLLVATEIGFPDLVSHSDLTAYKIEVGQKLKQVTGLALAAM
jgi:hypothetical protein